MASPNPQRTKSLELAHSKLPSADPTISRHFSVGGERPHPLKVPETKPKKLPAIVEKYPALSWLASVVQRDPVKAFKAKEYKTMKVLGNGSFAVVREVKHVPSGVHYAQKRISKQLVQDRNAMVGIKREMEILKPLNNGYDHPNIVNMFDCYETDKDYVLVFELASGGELLKRLSTRGKFTEIDATNIIFSLLDAVNFLHMHGIVHRDIKPANILYLTDKDDSDIVLTDFGVSNFVKEGQKLKTLAGTPAFSAPEVFKGTGHGKPADIWSVGCVAYNILAGVDPWDWCTNYVQMVNALAEGVIQFPDVYWKHISPQAVDFIKSCTKINPAERLTAQQAMIHPWLVRFNPRAKELVRILGESALLKPRKTAPDHDLITSASELAALPSPALALAPTSNEAPAAGVALSPLGVSPALPPTGSSTPTDSAKSSGRISIPSSPEAAVRWESRTPASPFVRGSAPGTPLPLLQYTKATEPIETLDVNQLSTLAEEPDPHEDALPNLAVSVWDAVGSAIKNATAAVAPALVPSITGGYSSESVPKSPKSPRPKTRLAPSALLMMPEEKEEDDEDDARLGTVSPMQPGWGTHKTIANLRLESKAVSSSTSAK
ncbi:kinase-like domain-containing protein [Cladochytrium replicatum]|nr:kinase-like domain-containing protein [Cladochytrium replicatum]